VDKSFDNAAVVHNKGARRFEMNLDGQTAMLTYRRFPGRIIFDHTEVPKPHEGHGIAARLARAVLDFARANQLQVVPLCPYVSSFIRKHAEYQDLLSATDLQKLKSG